MASISSLLINGAKTDFAQILLTVQGTLVPIPLPIVGESAINYDEEMDGQIVHGTAQMPIGQTLGQYSCTASMTMYKPEYEAFINSLASQGAFLPTSGFMTQFFNMNLSYTLSPLAPLVSDTLLGCRIKKDSEAHKTGGEALTVTVDLSPIIIIKNGIMPTNDASLASVLLGLSVPDGIPFTF